MRVAMIAPGQEKDGVKKYTDFLTEKLEAKVEQLERFSLSDTASLFDALNLSIEVSGYDIVHVQYTPEWWGNLFGYFWGSYLIPFLLFSRAKTVVTAHEYEFDHENMLVYKIQELKNQMIYMLADRVIVHNERGKEYIQEFAPCAEAEVIPHGIPEVEETDKELDIDGNVLLVFGFIRRDKDYETVFEVLQELPDDHHLLIAGAARTEEDEEYEEELKEKVEETGLEDRVTFYGYVPDEEIGKVFNSADVSLLPYESSSGSGVLALSLAYKVPVVMSEIPLSRQLSLKTYESKNSLTKLIKSLDEDNQYIEYLSKLRSERTWEEVAERTEEVYKNLR